MPAPLVGLGIAVASRLAAKKVAQQAVKKVAKTAAKKVEAKALKAAKGPSLASKDKKLEASSGKYERNITKMKAETNQILGSSKKEAYTKAAKAMDKEQSQSKKMAATILKVNKAGAKAEKRAAAVAKVTKKTK